MATVNKSAAKGKGKSVKVQKSNQNRINFGSVEEVIELPDLLDIQKNSFRWLIGSDFAPKSTSNSQSAIDISEEKTGIQQVFDSLGAFPFVADKIEGELRFRKVYLDEPKITINEAKKNKGTYASDIYASVEMIENINDPKSNKKTQTIRICELPLMTNYGTFIISGNEKTIVSQLVRCPGIFFSQKSENVFNCDFRPQRGTRFEFEFVRSADANKSRVRVNRKIACTLPEFLILIGFRSDDEVRGAFKGSKFIEGLFPKGSFVITPDPKKKSAKDGEPAGDLSKKDAEKKVEERYKKAVESIYKALSTSAYQSNSFENKESFVSHFFFEGGFNLGTTGRFMANRKLGLNTPLNGGELDETTLIAAIKYLGDLISKSETEQEKFILSKTPINGAKFNEVKLVFDDTESLANRYIRHCGRLIYDELYSALANVKRDVSRRSYVAKVSESSLKATELDDIMVDSKTAIRGKKEKADDSVVDAIVLDPKLILSRCHALIRADVNKFFRTSNLCQFIDEINPIASIANKRRITVIGEGGIRKSAGRVHVSQDVRDVNHTYYGRICPIESPEGQNSGLVSALACFSRVNELGFIETPYRRVKNGKVTDQVDWLDASAEEDEVIAHANQAIGSDGKFTDETVLARFMSVVDGNLVGGVRDFRPEDITYIDVSPKQAVSVGTSLIPFLEHDDAHRALMGTNMQKQAVPLVKTESPLVGTGSEYSSGIDSGDVVLYQDGYQYYEDPNSYQSIKTGGVVKSVSDYTCEIMSDDGSHYTFVARKFDKSNQTTCISNNWIVNEGDRVEIGQPIADGMATKDGELAIGTNLLVAYMNWGGYNYEDAIILSNRLVKDDTLTSIHIEDFMVETMETKLGDEEITRDIPNVSEAALQNLDEEGIITVGSEVKPGDILVGKVTPKGEKGYQSALDRLFSDLEGEKKNKSLVVPTGVSGTVIGVQELDPKTEHALRCIKVFIATKRPIGPGDKLSGRHGNKGVVSVVLPEEDMPFMEDGTPIDIVLNPLGVPSRMNLGQVLEVHLGWIAKNGWDLKGAGSKGLPKNANDGSKMQLVSTPVFDGVKHDDINSLLESYAADDQGNKLVHADGKATLFDGRTGEKYPDDIAVGYMYILKLHHLVEEKVHARSVPDQGSGRKAITRQPLGGRANNGGQRMGNMEVWALEAYGASNILQEMLTIKADHVEGTKKAFNAISKFGGFSLPELMNSTNSMIATFDVLKHYIKGVGIAFDIQIKEAPVQDNIFADVPVPTEA